MSEGKFSTRRGGAVWNACLVALSDLSRPNGECCVGFKPLTQCTGLPRPVVRRVVRAMARAGLAEYYRALLDDDGHFAGAGYCVTREGRNAALEIEGGESAA